MSKQGGGTPPDVTTAAVASTQSDDNDDNNGNDDEDYVIIDGSYGEGGGQILRNAISYAVILQQNVIIDKIRHHRSKPGLRAQHLKSAQLPVAISGGRLEEDELGSTKLVYTAVDPVYNKSGVKRPRNTATTQHGIIASDIGTAGSIVLLLQSALPCALLSSSNSNDTPIRLTLIGGTNASMAPQYDYWILVFWPMMRDLFKLPLDTVKSNVKYRGYFPQGGGQVDVTIKSITDTAVNRSDGCLLPLPAIDLTQRGDIVKVYIRAFCAGLVGMDQARQVAQAAHKMLSKELLNGNNDVVVDFEQEIAQEPVQRGSGLGIVIVASTSTGCRLAGSALDSNNYNKKGTNTSRNEKAARDIGTTAARELLAAIHNGGCVDEWLQDQLILYMALAQGESLILIGSLPPTLHTTSAIWVAEQMLQKYKADHNRPKFTIEHVGSNSISENSDHGMKAGQYIIKCRGIGYQ